MVPPRNWAQVGVSFKIRKARMLAPMGSNTIAMEMVEVLNHFSDQLKENAPKGRYDCQGNKNPPMIGRIREETLLPDEIKQC